MSRAVALGLVGLALVLGTLTGLRHARFDPSEAVARAAALHARSGGDPASCTGTPEGGAVRVSCDGAAYLATWRGIARRAPGSGA